MSEKNNTKQYSERDIESLDAYMTHVMAMTAEQLNGKSKIAAELAWRDSQIATLQQKLDAMAAENAALTEFGEKLKDMHNNLNGEGTGIQGRAEVACQQAALEAAMEEFDTIKTPATDAYLKSVRAEGVDIAVSEVKYLAKRNAQQAPEVSVHLHASAIRLTTIAAQLRSGTHDTADKAGTK